MLVGGAAAFVQFAVLATCLQVLDLNYKMAAAVAYIASVVFHFFANRQFTFKLCGNFRLKEVLRYLIIVVANLLVTMVVVVFVIEIMKSTPYLATVFSIVISVGVTFMASKYWVFNRREIS